MTHSAPGKEAAQGRARGGDGQEEPAERSSSSVGPTGLAQKRH